MKMSKNVSKKMVVGLVTATSFLVIGGNASANDLSSADSGGGITIEARYFNPSLTFKAQTSSIDYNGGALDFKNDLGITDKSSMEYRVQLGDNFRLSYANFAYNGNATLNQNLNYQGTTYAANALVASDLGIKYARLTWFKTITQSDDLSTKFILDLKGFQFNTSVNAVVNGSPTSAAKTFTGAIPTIGFAVNARLDNNFVAFGEITGLPLGQYGHFYDGEAGIRYNFDKTVAVNLGYRALDLSVKDPSSGDNAEFKIAGPFINAQYKF